MPNFRKKPVVIQAERISKLINLAARDWAALPEWFRVAYEKGDVLILPSAISVQTLEGPLHGRPDDWLICGVKGELYPCKPDIFEQTYERAR